MKIKINKSITSDGLVTLDWTVDLDTLGEQSLGDNIQLTEIILTTVNNAFNYSLRIVF
jgi:hypothetical protein